MTARLSVGRLVERHFTAYNAARLREACLLVREKMLAGDGLVVLTLSGALTPAGLGASCVVPLIEAGLVDVIVSTGANLFHDLHHGLDLTLERGTPFGDDTELRRRGKVRIYDIVLDAGVLFTTDEFVRRVVARLPPGPLGTAELHHHLGRALLARAARGARPGRSLLAAAARCGVPVYSSAPGDSAIGMNLAAVRLRGAGPTLDPALDVNETAAFVWDARRGRRTTGAILLGGGSPKNFALQTAPHLEEVLGFRRREGFGLDYFVQLTDARPDTGGLSGATPSEAVSWGKVLPAQLPDTVVCYADSTIAFPILASFALGRGRRPPRRLYDRRAELGAAMGRAYRRGRG
jgi:deoxyhypusine synthase